MTLMTETVTIARADFQRAKSELIRRRIAEKQRKLISLDEAISTTDEMIGLVLTHMSGMAARCAGPDRVHRPEADEAASPLLCCSMMERRPGAIAPAEGFGIRRAVNQNYPPPEATATAWPG
jgi:hypothetical protein